jgi:hypothetical protein
VWVSTRPTFGQTAVTLLECEAAASRYATCGAELGVEDEDRRVFTPEVPLVCHVEGAGAGEYFCSYPRPPA